MALFAGVSLASNWQGYQEVVGLHDQPVGGQDLPHPLWLRRGSVRQVGLGNVPAAAGHGAASGESVQCIQAHRGIPAGPRGGAAPGGVERLARPPTAHSRARVGAAPAGPGAGGQLLLVVPLSRLHPAGLPPRGLDRRHRGAVHGRLRLRKRDVHSKGSHDAHGRRGRHPLPRVPGRQVLRGRPLRPRRIRRRFRNYGDAGLPRRPLHPGAPRGAPWGRQGRDLEQGGRVRGPLARPLERYAAGGVAASREGRARTHILVHIFNCCVQVFNFGLMNYDFLYTRKKFSWDYNSFTLWSIVSTPLSSVGTIVVMPLLSYYFRVEDSMLGFAGGVSSLFTYVLRATAPAPWVFYLSSVVSLLSSTVLVASRAAVSKLAETTELGAVFAVLAASEAVIPVLSSFVYTYIYNATLETFPGTIYVTAAVGSVVVCCSYTWLLTHGVSKFPYSQIPPS
nr:uncharacterized protein LOC113817350 [Penaeus vannamei]